MIVLGIDPGLNGAIAFLRPDEMKLIKVIDIPTMGKKPRVVDINNLFLQLSSVGHVDEPVICWLEEAWARPAQGVSSAFKCGRVIGNIEAVMVCHGFPIRTVTPAAWKKHLGLAVKGKTKHDSRALATRMFPASADLFSRVKDDGRAEASLVAVYGAERAGVVTSKPADRMTG